MQEALEWAADYAQRAKIFEPIRNERGYADGWKPPTPAEKASVITELAREACDDGGSGFVAAATPEDWIRLRREVDRLQGIHQDIDKIGEHATADRLNNVINVLMDLAGRNGA